MDIQTDKSNHPRGLPRWLTPRRAIGFGICAIGFLVLLGSMIEQIMNANPKMLAALAGGSTAAAATALGTLPVLFAQNFTKRTYDCFLGFGAGVMLGATAFSLVIPALSAAKTAGAGNWESSLMVGAGIMFGAGAILLLGRAVRTEGILSNEPDKVSLRRAWLFVWAVALHNLPEGLAIGVAFAGIDVEKATSLATGVSIQDVPEGLVVALALHAVGYSRLTAVAMGVASGLVEPIAAVFGVALIGISAGLLPYALAAAAGAMLLVIVNDVIPESRQSGNGTQASIALIFGFILMTVLDTALS
ncbi:ZIP family zinc transporter [Massilia sp. UYP32]|jgi:zinc transporter, ZIP family|uniref:ZIP Zinc transporter family protein n=1 Tax=Massilia timonae TaxID=47229 RepID=A0A1S2NGB4_9BURK|nr:MULTISPECIES: ZIP family metal transporter [Massilia]OIJ44078.1 ZIP Zinc transporter family protein [Massilia timonae]QYG02869.1 ZIP family metal transporter [Massilia sp. NP310]